MITSYLINRRVSWNTLHKIKLGRSVEYIRKMNFGVVVDVSTCGNLCLVVEDNGNRYEIETPELVPID